MDWAGLPQLLRDRERGNLHVRPPVCFAAAAVQLLMVLAADRHSKLVADLSPKATQPRDLKVVRIARGRLADQARLRGDEGQVRLAPLSDRLC